MDIKDIYSKFKESSGICTDTRKISKNSIFVALKGASFNGNQYAKTALESGCSYAIIDEEEFTSDSRMIVVNDALECLQKLANHHRKQLKIPFIGITGTNGKTTTKELIAAVLSENFTVAFTQGNFNNHIGVPLTLLSITDEAEIAIIEMGANHVGEIHELCEIAEPDYGIITNVGKAHLEGFGSFENIIKTKTDLYRWVENHGTGIFLNNDDEILKEYASKIVSTYSNSSEEAQSYTVIKEQAPFLTVSCPTEIKTKLFGSYNLYNIAAAISIGRYFKMDDSSIKAGLENYTPSNNRSQIQKTDKNTLFIDAYNANPTSMEAALKNFASLDIENKIVILGEMFELGDKHTEEHSKIEALCKDCGFTLTLLAGNWPQSVKSESIKYLPTTESLNDFIATNEITNSNILLKGSRGMKLETLIPLL